MSYQTEAMEMIYVLGLEGKTNTFSYPIGALNQATVESFQKRVEYNLGIKVSQQVLIFKTKELQASVNRLAMTLGDYGIKNNSNIILATKLPGGYQ